MNSNLTNKRADRFIFSMCKFGFGIALGMLLTTREAPAQELSGSQYDRPEARSVQTVKTGVIRAARRVTITTEAQTETKVAAGALGGALLGYLTRNSSGLGQVTASGIGAVGGSLLAGKLGRSEVEAVEYIVTLSTGQTIAVTQAIDSNMLAVGEMVALLEGRQARVVPLR